MQLPLGSIIASGPVIIEDNKVLLNKERAPDGHITKWYFPGGETENFDIPLEETCRREAKEEMGIELEIIRPLATTLGHRSENRIVILVHYLAKRIGEIKPGTDIVEWAWHDINNLPTDCAPNVYEIIKDYLQTAI